MIKDKFRELSKYLIWPIKSGSGYYWEIRYIYVRDISILPLYTMQDDCAWQRPEDQPVKRRE